MKIACSAHKNKTRDDDSEPRWWEWPAIFAGRSDSGRPGSCSPVHGEVGPSPMIELVIEPAGTAGLFIGRVGNESVVRSRQLR
jgi:hypothetical protein